MQPNYTEGKYLAAFAALEHLHLLHRGRYTDDRPLQEHLTVLREVVVRTILTMLNFQGSYESYLRDPTWRSFPPTPAARSEIQ